ncbi:hypothetical protein ACEPAF_5437 [Sanghuangporus sanghuang]
MSQPGPSQFTPGHPDHPDHYSLEVLRVDNIQNNPKKGNLYVEPTSRAILPFEQSDSRSVIDIFFKQSRKRSQDRFLGHVEIKEDVAKLLQDSLPYEFKHDLTGTVRSLFRRKETMTTGTIHLCLNVTDERVRARLWVGMAERRVENIRTSTERGPSADSVLEPIIQAMDQIVEIADKIAEIHPLLNLSWKAASAVYKLISYQFKADAKLVDMVEKMKDAFHFSAEAHNLNDRTEMLKPTIKELLEETTNCSRAVKEYASHGFVGRIGHWPDGKKVEEYAARFAELRKKLDSVIIVNTAKGVDNIESRQMLQLLQMQLELTNMDISKLSTRSRCLEGTRKDYMDRIMSKLFADTDTEQNIVWLTGAAGAGKSTIAVTISDACDRRGCPAAYLFFERGKDEYIFTVRAIAHRLVSLHSIIRPHLVNAMKVNSNIIGSPLRTQFEKLLLEPIQMMAKGTESSVIIILDGLDECGTSTQREDLVRLLTTEFKRLPSDVRVLVTSRPENDILEHLSLKSHIHHIELEHTTQESRRDIDLYMRKRMISVVRQGTPEGWEWDGICEVLSGAADGLFIWASTAVKMVSESIIPQDELRALLDNIKSVGDFGMDTLYATVLKESRIFESRQNYDDQFRRILGLVLFAKEVLTGEIIEAHLELRKGMVGSILGQLRSVISYEPGKPVRLHHASFADYLTSKGSDSKPWNIDESGQKLYIAKRCFEVMSEKLCFNICGIESSFLRNDKVPDLRDRIKKAIPRHLDYACRFWSVHLCETPNPDGLLEKLNTFANDHLLYWFEVLSLTKHYNRVAGQALLNSTLRTAPTDAELSSSLWAAYRLSATFALPISQSVPHIYLSALSLCQNELPVAQHYSSSHPIVQVHQYGQKPLAQCIKVLEGHRGNVYSVVFSPDGKRIASGSADRTVRIWDADSGEVVSGPFEGHADSVNSVAFSPDGKRVASGSQDSTIRVWDADNGEPVLSPLEGHTGWVWSVTFSPDGKCIASGSSDRTIRVWDVDSGKAAADPFEGHTGPVYSVVFCPDGKCIASGSLDKSICVWDAASGKLVAGLFQRFSGPISSIAFSHDGKRIALCSEKTVRVWDMYSGKLLGSPIKGHTREVRSVVFFPDGMRIASGSYDNTICVCDTDSGELVAGPFKGHTSWVQSVAFSPDGKRIASGSLDGTIRIWDAESGKFASDESQERSGPVNSVAFSPNGKCIASGSADRTIRVWDVESGELVSGPFIGHTDWVHSVAFSPDGKHIASGSGDKTICVWDAGSGELILEPFKGHTGSVRSVAFSPDGRLVASGSADKTICVRNCNSGRLVAGPFKGHRGRVNSVSFSPDGKTIASGSDDRTIRVWNVGSGELVAGPFVGHTGTIWSVMYSPDGKCIASGSGDQTVRVWNANSGDLLVGPFERHRDVRSVSFSSDGKYIASGSFDSSVCIWAVDGGEPVLDPFNGHSGPVYSVVFSPDGRCLASGSLDGTVRVWKVNSTGFKTSSSYGKDTGITSLDRGSYMENERIVSNWSLSDDGWALGPGGELLAWIPEDMRSTLCRDRNTVVIGQGFSTRLDLANSPLGEDWCKGFPLTDGALAGR